MPLRDYLCDYCGYEFTELMYSTDPEDYATTECRCGSKAKVLPSLIGGYHGNMGSSSTRPKNSTSMKRAKVFTGHPGNEGEPPSKEEQLDFDFTGGE
jgi:DNA-directed RNA polymerase subunit RPC12/RpoP